MDIKPSIVAILGTNKKIIGTGFLAGENLILTCAHVVERVPGVLLEQVTVRFSDKTETIAQIDRQSSSPSINFDTVDDETIKGKDVALLKVGFIPSGIAPLPLGNSAGSTGHDFYAYGYAIAANVQGIGARGKIVDIVENGCLVQLEASQPDNGMSGGPVWDEQLGIVIGMVTKGKNKPTADQSYKNINTVFAISVETIGNVCPELDIVDELKQDDYNKNSRNITLKEKAANSVIVAGDGNQLNVEITSIDTDILQEQSKTRYDWVVKRFASFATQQHIWFSVLLLAIIGAGVGVVWSLRKPVDALPMSGDFRIAIASFYENGNSGQEKLGYDLAENVHLRLVQDVKELNPKLVVTIWGPDKVGAITGTTAEERALTAQKIAQQIHADMVIYGVVDINQDSWQVLPEFYISADNFYEAEEIVGQNDLGTPFSLPSASNTAWRTEFGQQMFARGKALSIMSVGLGYFALHQYDKSLETFTTGFDIQDWQDDQGKKVLYLMASNAAGKVGETMYAQKQLEKAITNFDLGQQFLEKALAIDPQYARPYIGLANLNYMRALQPYEVSQKRQDVDTSFLDKCYQYLDQAHAAQDKPPLADVETKIHLARGQCILLDVLSGRTSNIKLAVDEFEQVVTDYADGANPRVKELAAEAHGRLGLIYRLTNKKGLALGEYQQAADLLKDYPERQMVYRKAIATLSATSTP